MKYEVEYKRAEDKKLAQDLTEILNDGCLEKQAKALNDPAMPMRVINCIKEMAALPPRNFKFREITEKPVDSKKPGCIEDPDGLKTWLSMVTI